MKVCFDTSVLVAAVVDQLANHESACACFVQYSQGKHRGCCSTHALAECYATLTALPLPRKIQAAEALILIEENFIKRLEILALSQVDYAAALTRSSQLGLVSGVWFTTPSISSQPSGRAVSGSTPTISCISIA